VTNLDVAAAPASRRPRSRTVARYLRRNPSLPIGILLILALLAFSILGQLFYDTSLAAPLSVQASQPPSFEHPFGTDTQGRDLFAAIIIGTTLTLRIGLIAGGIGLFVGGVLGFVSAYFGGWVDAVIKLVIDVLLTVPALLVLVIVASAISGTLDPTGMALVIAVLAWRRPARQIRTQVMVMRQAGFVRTAQISGCGPFTIIFREILPNLLPFLAASFIIAVSAAILASIGLEALGLGSQSVPTLGMTVFWMMQFSAVLLGMWWWVLAPITVLILLFVGLYLITAGLDELANPRLRKRA
jgi:peptide/nickel transport system permease protein